MTSIRKAVITISGIAPYTQSRFHGTPKLDGELPDAYEERTWKNKAHVMPDGRIFIPAVSIMTCIKDAAKFMNRKIPGKGNETWTKHFDSGIIVSDNIVLNTKIDDAIKLTAHVPSDGVRGGSKRVLRHYPTVPAGEWGGTVEILILDDVITKDIFTEVCETAGHLIGLGTFRVRNRSTHGRFNVTVDKW